MDKSQDALLRQLPEAAQRDATVLDGILSTVQERAGAEALRSGPDRLSYKQLLGAAQANAEGILDAGAKRGDIVLCTVRSGIGLPLAWVSAMLAGVVIVPVDASWPKSRCRQIVQSTGARLILVSGHHQVSHFTDLIELEIDPSLSLTRARNPSRTAVSTLLYGFFTSGSTGAPKCALNHHEGIVNRFRYMTKRFGSGHVVYQNSAPLFDSSIWQMIWPLTSGGVAVIPEAREVWDLEQVVRDIAKHRVTMTDFVPTLFSQLVKALATGRIAASSLATLRHILIGGEQIDARAVQHFRRMLPECEVVNTYGHTEASIGMVFHSVSDADGLDIPLGAPIDNTYVKITDAQLKPVAEGEVGEIVVGGVCVGAGYLGRADLTHGAFFPNPFSDVPGSRVYRTGDFGRRRADGLLEYCGRADDQIKLNGVRIELGEIEEVAKAIFPQLADVRALVVSGQQNRLLALAYAAEQPLEHQTMRRVLATRLPKAHVPRLFLHKKSLPITANGKIDRHALLAEAGRLVVDRSIAGTDLRSSILAAFRDSLGAELTVEDDFFECGGDSLAALELATRLEQLLSRAVATGDIYRHPNVESLAAMLESECKAESNCGALPIPTLAGVFSRPAAPARTVLLTGATGFVGVHIFYALLQRPELQLHIVARAASGPAARQRLTEAYREAFDAALDLGRVQVHAGDLAQPQFGLGDLTWSKLATEVEEVIHAGAEVNFMAPASQLYATNVLGTAEAIHLCGAGRPKRLHMISSLAARHIKGDTQVRESQQHRGYAVSKWLAEQTVMAAARKGLHASVYRVDDVLPSAVSGHGNPRSLLHLLLQKCVEMRTAPEGFGKIGLLSADRFATWLSSLVGVSADVRLSTFEVTGDGYMDFRDLVEACCASQECPVVRRMSTGEFVRTLESSSNKNDRLLVHMLREQGNSLLFTRADQLISIAHLPMRQLLAADTSGVLKFIRRSAGTKALNRRGS
jgi:amino acid adenylation domain-containing protein/thioester reductase-like protein